jgi:hypothetical protein
VRNWKSADKGGGGFMKSHRLPRRRFAVVDVRIERAFGLSGVKKNTLSDYGLFSLPDARKFKNQLNKSGHRVKVIEVEP